MSAEGGAGLSVESDYALTEDERDALYDWWDDETTVSVESSFPLIARIIRAHMAQAFNEGIQATIAAGPRDAIDNPYEVVTPPAGGEG